MSNVKWSSLGRTSSCFALLVAAASCSSGSTQPSEEGDPGAIQGELVVYVADYEDHSETRYFLRDARGTRRRLAFHGSPPVAPGAQIRVWGAETAGTVQVTSFKVIAPSLDPRGIGSLSSSLIGVDAEAPRKFCAVLVDLGNGLGSITAQTVSTQFFTGARSVNAYYRENSYGKDGIAGKVFGPYPYRLTACNSDDGGDMDIMADALLPKLPETCDQYGFVFARTGLCAWAGLGQVGTPSNPKSRTWYNGSLSCVASVQEPLHNMGLHHASTIDCGNIPFADNLSGCTHDEYGDRLDTMGDGCRHTNVFNKQYQNWLGGCNIVKVTSTGTFNLFATETPCNGIQALQIPFPGGKKRPIHVSSGADELETPDTTLVNYYLEYRISSGFDTGLTPQVLLHADADIHIDFQHTFLINLNPTTSNPGFRTGQTFNDPAGGLSITVTAMDAQKATVEVKVTNGSGAPTCLDGTTLAPPGPTTCSGGVMTNDAGIRDSGGGAGGNIEAGRDAQLSDAVGSSGGASAGDGAATGGSFGSGGTNGVGDASRGARSPVASLGDEGGCSCRLAARTSETRALGRVGGLLFYALGALARFRRADRRRRLRAD